ncbi:DUF655 domain-containing protein [Candidatus Bathyarchaeota archaeon]|nr:DUF655 domain-containing protein [Candidatus Bathyarchaeota archaeon]
MERAPKKYEEYAYILDDLPRGKPGASRSPFQGKPLLQLLGENFFTLLEAVPRAGMYFEQAERIYVGKKGRTKVEHVLGRISFDELTSTAKSELQLVVETIVKEDVSRFMDFFNNSQPITPRMHSLELIPGIGKRLMWQIIEQRERVPFDSYEDLQTRTSISDPVKLLTKRILKELSEDEKYYLFTRPIV